MALSKLRKAWRRPAAATSAFALAVAGLVGVTAAPAHAATTMNLGYVADYDGYVRVLDLATNTIIGSIAMPATPNAVVPSPDGRTAYVLHDGSDTYDDSVSVVDPATSTVTDTVGVCHNPDGATMRPHSTELWIPCYSGSISVFDTATRAVTRTIRTSEAYLNGLSFTPDGSTVYMGFSAPFGSTSGPPAGILVMDTASGSVSRTIVEPQGGGGPAVSPDGSTFFTVDDRDHSLTVIDAASGTTVSTIPLGGEILDSIADPDGTGIDFCVGGTSLVQVDLVSRSVTKTVPMACSDQYDYGSMSLAPDGRTLYVTTESDITALDLATGTLLATIPRTSSTLVSLGPAPAYVQAALAPTVSGISPAQGPQAGGGTVVITGGPFVGGSGATGVEFGGVPVGYVVDSDSQITATVPPHTFGTVDVTVTNDNGTGAVGPADQYTYQQFAPTISSLSPNSGVSRGGTTVTITGTDLTTTKSVYFGGTAAASFTIDSATQITAVTRAQTNGTVNVTVTNAIGASTSVPQSQFTFFSPVPVVTGVGPAAGTSLGGTTVTISGLRFTGAFRVMFGGVAVPYTLDSDSQITVVTPPWSSAMAPAAGATTPTGSVGVVDVQVTTDVDTSATGSADQYDYTAPA